MSQINEKLIWIYAQKWKWKISLKMRHFRWFSNSVLKCCKIGASFAKTTTRWDWPRRLLIDLDWEKRERLKHRCYNPLAHIRKMKAQVMPKAKLTKNIFFVNPGVFLESRLWINNCPFGAFLMRQFECNTTFNRRSSIHFRKQSFIAF